MSVTRYYEETPCEHGEVQQHLIREVVEKAIAEAAGAPIPPITPCPGGRRRELTPIPAVKMGGLTPAYYPTDEEPDAIIFPLDDPAPSSRQADKRQAPDPNGTRPTTQAPHPAPASAEPHTHHTHQYDAPPTAKPGGVPPAADTQSTH